MNVIELHFEVHLSDETGAQISATLDCEGIVRQDIGSKKDLAIACVVSG
jgi:hypothetical protein